MNPKVGLMKLQPVPGEYRYAVVVRDLADLRLTLWVKRSRKGEFFIMLPRGDREWDVHTSYHLDGTLRMKSHGSKAFTSDRRQPLNGTFRGSEHLGTYFGYGPKSVGAICDPMAFAGVVEVSPDVWGPMDGWVAVEARGARHRAHYEDPLPPNYHPKAIYRHPTVGRHHRGYASRLKPSHTSHHHSLVRFS